MSAAIIRQQMADLRSKLGRDPTDEEKLILLRALIPYRLCHDVAMSLPVTTRQPRISLGVLTVEPTPWNEVLDQARRCIEVLASLGYEVAKKS